MRPRAWPPPIPASPAEAGVVRRIRRAELFGCVRQRRHDPVDAAVPTESAALYTDGPFGQPPGPPAQRAVATPLQAYAGVGGGEATAAAARDRRRPLAPDGLDTDEAPVGKGALVAFRRRPIAAGPDRRPIERTVEAAAHRGDPGRAGCGRPSTAARPPGRAAVEGTYRLPGHAPRKAVGGIARRQGRELAAAAGLARVLATPERGAAWLDRRAAAPPAAAAALAVAPAAVAPDAARRGRGRHGRAASASRTARCATGARAAPCWWTGASGTWCATSAAAWPGRTSPGASGASTAPT